MSMPQSMRAARFYGPGPDGKVVIENVPVPEPGPKQVLVRIQSAGLCGSDMALWKGTAGASPKGSGSKWTITPGHEACGTIVQCGSEAKRFREGMDIGFLQYLDACDDCDACKVSSIACPVGTVQGFSSDGFLAEYALVQESQATVLPEGLDPKKSAPLLCAGLTAFHAVDKAGLQPGDWIAIVGIGGLGHLAVQYASKMGLKVIGLDIGPKALQTALDFGADAVFDSKEADVPQKVREKTGGQGVGAAVVLSGSPKAYEVALSTIKLGGTLMVVGITEPNALPLHSIPVSIGLVQVKGASSGRAEEMSKALAFTAKHDIKVKMREFSLNDVPQMVDDQMGGKEMEGRWVVTSFS